MSSGSFGSEIKQAAYERQLRETREALATAEVVGQPKPSFELSELHRLIERYPDQARAYLDEIRPPRPPDAGIAGPVSV